MRRWRWRRGAVLVHRYVGLTIAVFLVMAGLTGALLAFYHELDGLLNPALTHVAPSSQQHVPLDPFELQSRFAAELPKGAKTDATVHFDLKPGEVRERVDRAGGRRLARSIRRSLHRQHSWLARLGQYPTRLRAEPDAVHLSPALLLGAR